MATAITLPNVQAIYEGFAPVNGFVNGCGQAAVLMMSHIVTGQPVSVNELLNLIKYSIATGHATTSGKHIGATTPAELQWLAEQEGVKTTLGPGSAWRSTVDTAIPQGKPVIIGLKNARALGGNDVGVSGHFVTVVGMLNDGRYIVADPNQPAARTGGTVVYTAQQIQAAQPTATLTPVASTKAQSQQTAGGPCAHRVHFDGGPGGIGAFDLCLDPLVDGVIRGALIGTGVLLIIVAILIFTRNEWAPVAGEAAKVGAAAAI